MQIDLDEINLEAAAMSAGAILAQAEQSTRGRGKAGMELVITAVKELSADAVAQVGKAQVGIDATPKLLSIRATHHQLAKLLAQGYKDIDVAKITGYSPSRISILKRDPSFREIVSHYANVVEQAFTDTVGKMKDVTDTALAILDERLTDDEASFTNGMLLEVATKLGDRAGFAPVQKTISATIPLDHGTLAGIKERVLGRQNGQVNQINQSALDATYEIV